MFSFLAIDIFTILSVKKNPLAIRLAEERRGLEQLTMSTAVNLSRAGQLSSHVYNVCSEAREAIYTSQEDAKHWLDKGQPPSPSMEAALFFLGVLTLCLFLSISFLWFCSLLLNLPLSLSHLLFLTLSLTWSSLCLSLSLPIPPFLSSLAISPFLTLSLLSLLYLSPPLRVFPSSPYLSLSLLSWSLV